MVFPGGGAGAWSFLCCRCRWYFFFLENMILFFRQKMKDDLSQKKYMEIWYFLEISWKDGLSKKSAPDYTILFSFSRKYDLVLQAENEDHPSQKKKTKQKKTRTHIFCVFCKSVAPFSYGRGVTLLPKSKDDLFVSKYA